jgi:RHS repeat-associated protein
MALTTVLSPVPAAAAAARGSAPHVQRDRVVPGHTVGARSTSAPVVRAFKAQAPSWPAATTGDVDTTANAVPPAGVAAQAGAAGPATVAVGPVRVAPAGATAARVRVQVLDRAATAAAGVRGLLVRVGRMDGATSSAPVGVTIDYNAFRTAYGGDWASRLRLVEMPACALTTPGAAGCTATPLATRDDTGAGTLSATVNVAPQTAGGVLVATQAGTSGGSGSFAATTLSPSASWSVDGNSGAFTWSYPLRTPPSVGGPSPSLALTYSSSAVDGEQSATNNQPSWIGEGFDLSAGYIERSYIPCAQDMGAGANNSTATGDLCWSTDNATLSLGGHSGDLIKDGSDTNRWHLRDDDGTFVEHLTGGSNGAHSGEYWRVTTTDGTQYWFGSTASANSTWTEPVYGNNSGEPCHQTDFASSSCTQAWRWNLDKIVDTSGNTITYRYAVETNEYAADDNATAPVIYDRGGYLTEIDYGTTASSSGPAPQRVLFTTGPRCITSSCGTHDATDWPDTPWDQQCTGSPCYTGSPTFWSDVMLNSVSTQLYSGTGTTYSTVTTWALKHTFPDPGDNTRAGLWLSSIQQTGYDGGTTSSTPAVTFNPVQLANRVEPINGLAPMNWMRVAQITTESGAEIQVTYSAPDCVPGKTMPDVNNLQNNSLRCYPVITPASGTTPASTEFFNKYRVDQLNVADLTTPGNPTTTAVYTYVGTPAWHYTDDNGVVPAGTKTWSVWRGFGDVRVTTGTGGDATTKETVYFRGMNGDHLPSGTRGVQLAALDMNGDGNTSDSVDLPAANDDDALAGQPRESVVWNGTAMVSATGNSPWESAPTATRTASGITVNAVMTGVADTRTETVLDGGRAARTASTHTDHDPTTGLPVAVQDNGDDAVSGDETCMLTDYDQKTSTDGTTWLIDFPSRVQKYATTCATAKAGGLTAAQVISDTLTYYDGATSITAAPTRGLPTRTDSLKDWVNGAAVYLTTGLTGYDGYGRTTSSTDVRGNATTTAYSTNTGGQISGRTVTNALGWTTTTTIDPVTGHTLTSTDPNGRITAQAYDGLGRLIAVWQPGRDQATQSANTTYTYTINDNAPSVVATAKLLPSGGHTTTYVLYDGMLRPRQTQAPRGDGAAGALITDTFYDTAGRAYLVNSLYLAAVTPGSGLFVANQQSDVPQYTTTTYDGAGRTVSSTVAVNSTGTPAVFSTATTAYGGDRVDVTPPSGATATSTITDVRGNTVELRQYHGPTPTPFTTGSYDKTTYTYDTKDEETQVTDPAGNVFSFGYDLRGRQVRNSDPDSGTSTTVYDDAGDVTSTTDARGVTLAHTYDQLGRETGLYQGSVSSANQLSAWTYDGIANSRGQLTRTTRYDNGNAYTVSTLGLTADYQPTAVQYAIPAAETGLAGTYTYAYAYNVDGSLNSTRVPSLDGGLLATETLTDGYTGLGRPYSLSTSLPTATTLVPSIAYTGYGETAQIALETNGGASAWITDSYATGTRRITESSATRQVTPTTVSDTHYSYDAAGDVTEISDSVTGDDQCFGYDYLDRLTSAWTPADGNCAEARSVAALGGPAQYWTDWTFDASGNRTGQTAHDAPNGVATTTYTTPGAGAVQPHALTGTSTTDSTGTRTASYTTDPAGDTTSRPSASGTGNQTLAWGPEGHLASITDSGATTSYVYDVDGTRLIQRDSTGKTLYLPGQELRYTTATGTRATTRYYDVGSVTVAYRTTSGLTWLFSDREGTATSAINAASQTAVTRRMDPYGNARGTATGWPAAMTRGFVNGTPDATGLVHLGEREYDPQIGRFISVDPMIDYTKPQRLDGYAYSEYSPVDLSDPTGTDPLPGLCGAQAGWCVYYSTVADLYQDPLGPIGDGHWHFYLVGRWGYCRDYGLQCEGNNGNDQRAWVDTYIWDPSTNSYVPNWRVYYSNFDYNYDLGWCFQNPACNSGGGNGNGNGGNGNGGNGNANGPTGYGVTPPRRRTPTNSPCTGDYQLAPQGWMFGICLNESVAAFVGAGASGCLAVDANGIGWTRSTSAGAHAGAGIGGSFGIILSNGTIQGQSGWDTYGDLGGEIGPISADGGLAFSDTDPSTWDFTLNAGGGLGADFGSEGETYTQYGYIPGLCWGTCS